MQGHGDSMVAEVLIVGLIKCIKEYDVDLYVKIETTWLIIGFHCFKGVCFFSR